MTVATLVSRPSTADEQLSHFVKSAGFQSWRRRVQSVGGCAKPVRLTGSTTLEHPERGTLESFEGTLFVPCNNRRETVCEPCARRYAADTFHLVRAGLAGGKGVPESVASHVRVFATLTAPSFGPVHNRPTTRTGRPRPCRCGEFHHEADTRIGTPLDPASYDYAGAVLWQAHSTELWRRFTITTARHLAGALGIAPSQLREHLRVSYVKVAEYQRRGLVHFHAVIRVDGPDGPDARPPVGVTTELLSTVVRSAVAGTSVSTPESTVASSRVLGWGDQVDVEPITTGVSDEDALARSHQVAGYVAKYATKSTGVTSGVDRPIRSEHDIAAVDVSAHHRAMIGTAWRLGGLPEFECLNLRRWAHMLGFRGHFLTKSRHYSTTFTQLRDARTDHRHAEHLDRLGIADVDAVVVVNGWHMTGVGYRSDAERDMAAAIAARQLARRGPTTDGGL